MEEYRKIQRPKRNEYPPYSQFYFDLVKTDNDILKELHDNYFKLKKIITSLSQEQLDYRYSEGKWTIKEILVHNIDDERIFTYRALCYARNDKTPLPGFEEKDYATYSMANNRTLKNILQEYWHVRLATIQLFHNLPEEAFERKGVLIDENGSLTNERTVRALVYHIAGHELHHLNIIKERYLKTT